ncbi:MAG: SpoVR family protein [Bdellovibrionaceae bacterium]|nr:SpoVR family protein [Pseudobdellovibrionaceae bacterium]
MSLETDIAHWQTVIEKYAREEGLDFFDTIFELVDSEQINSLAAFGGFPVRYPHWRFGMDYDQLSKGYTWGMQKIYEMVINTDPSYAYLVRSNSMTDHKMVMAHVYGHVDFFKNNYWFSKTNRKMLDRMANNAVRVREMMETYGQEKVESFIDCCLALENLIDPELPFQENKKEDQTQNENPDGKLRVDRPYMEKFINPKDFVESQRKRIREEKEKQKKIPPEPQKDILLFLMNYAPLEKWEHDCLRIIREEAYYFVPQMQTKIMNEGWASYWHSKLMTEKIMTDDEVIDFADRHSGTMASAPGQINPYKLGIELFRDIEDRWNRGAFGKEYEDCDDLVMKANWDKKLGKGREKIFEVRKVYNDLTFIDAYLTPEFVERQKLYTYEFNRRTNQYEIVDRDFHNIKEKLLAGLTNRGQPFIYVEEGNFENRGELLLWHKHQGVDLDTKWASETLRSLERIWRRPVNIRTTIEKQGKYLRVEQGSYSEKLFNSNNSSKEQAGER